MRQRFAVVVAAVLCSLVCVPNAEAGFWAWLEEYSGPGPFKGWTFMFTGCVQNATFKSSPIAMNDEFHARMIAASDALRAAINSPNQPVTSAQALQRALANPAMLNNAILMQIQNQPAGQPLEPARLTFRSEVVDAYVPSGARHGPGHEDTRPVCAYFDQGFFHADADAVRGFPELSAHFTDVGPSARVHDGIDIGGGIGWVKFSGDTIDAKTHATVTPVRLIVRPLLLSVPEHHREPWMGFLTIYWKQTYVVGKLTGADFGAPQNPFSVDGEMVRSFGFNLDVTALLAQWIHPLRGRAR